MKKSHYSLGFTLIELIIVIVILGVLSVIAAPRFFNFTSEANEAVIKSMAASVDTLSQQVYAKALIAGVDSLATTNLDIDKDDLVDIELAYGYPSSDRAMGLAELLEDEFESNYTWATNYAETQFYIASENTSGRTGFYINQSNIVATECYLIYEQSTGPNQKPSISLLLDGC